MRKKTPEKTTGKPDWEAIAREYETCEGGISHRDLAEKRGVSLSTLNKRAARENWAARREAFWLQTGNEIRRRIQQLQAREIARDYERLQAATTIIDTAIGAGALEPNSLDSAIATLISLVKTKEVLGGGVSDRTEDASASAGVANLDEMRERLSESIHVLSVVLDHESRRAGTK